MLHRDGAIRLVIRQPRRARHEGERHQFTDEHNGMAILRTDDTPDVEAEIHLLEIAMKKSRHTKHVGVEKEKSDQAYEVSALALIELSAFWQKRNQHRPVYLEVEHREVAPLGGQEDASHLHARSDAGYPHPSTHFTSGSLPARNIVTCFPSVSNTNALPALAL